MTRITIAVFTASLLLATAPAAAHHGWSGYDQNRALTVTGTIKESGYEHPHGHIRLDAGDKTWMVTLAPPSRMERRGLPAAALRPGIRATVVAYPSRSHADEMRAERITVNGTTVELR